MAGIADICAWRPSSYEVAVVALNSSQLPSSVTGAPCHKSEISRWRDVGAALDRKATVSKVLVLLVVIQAGRCVRLLGSFEMAAT